MALRLFISRCIILAFHIGKVLILPLQLLTSHSYPINSLENHILINVAIHSDDTPTNANMLAQIPYIYPHIGLFYNPQSRLYNV